MLENQFKYGYVIGMLVSSIGDSLDAGRFPDVIPADVIVTFTRVRGQYKQPLDEPINGVKSMVVNHKPVTAMLTKEGYLTSDFDPVRKLVYEGATPGIWLVAGLYKVSLGGLLPDFEIQVTEDYTPENPLDIADWISYSSPPGSAVKLVNVPVGSDGQLMQWDSGGIVWKDREILQGPPNVLSIGTVTSADTPSARITGTSPNQELSLTLPKGDKGDKGDKGPPGVVSSASAYVLVGPGRPDQPATTGGVVAGTEPVGAEYRSQNGAGVGAYVWMKRPGEKWEVTDGDTGWRDISSVVEWIGPNAVGTFQLRRVRNTVHVRWAGVGVDKATSGFNTVTVCTWSIPGFEIMDNTPGHPFNTVGVGVGYSMYGLGEPLSYLGFMRESGKVHVRAYNPPLDTRRSGYHQWPTFGPWPTTLPGTTA